MQATGAEVQGARAIRAGVPVCLATQLTQNSPAATVLDSASDSLSAAGARPDWQHLPSSPVWGHRGISTPDLSPSRWPVLTPPCAEENSEIASDLLRSVHLR